MEARKIPKEYLSEENCMNFELFNYKRQKKFNDWFYSKIKPHLKGDILETGSGVGTFSERIAEDFKGKVYLTDIDPEFIKLLKEQFKGRKNVRVEYLDLSSKKDFSKIKVKFDSVLCTHVLEHIKDDVKALKLMGDSLKKNGNLIVVVPAHKFLYSKMDKTEGHYRRYSKNELEEKAEKAGLKIKSAFWFNMFAIPGRYLNGNVFGKKYTHQGSFNLFNKLVPFFRMVEERILVNFTGVNRIVILGKP